MVRGGPDVTKSPIRGFLRAGDVVMGFEHETCKFRALLLGCSKHARVYASHAPVPVRVLLLTALCVRRCVDGLEEANLAGIAVRAGSNTHTVTRLRVKRVNAGRLKMTNVLQGWTSIQTFEGDQVLQKFDLFDPEEYGTPTASNGLASVDGGWEQV